MGIATVTASVSLKASPSAVVRLAVMFATPFATAVVNPVAGSKVTIAWTVSSLESVAVGMAPVNGWPFWSKPRTEAVTCWPAVVSVTGPAVGMGLVPFENVSWIEESFGGATSAAITRRNRSWASASSIRRES